MIFAALIHRSRRARGRASRMQPLCVAALLCAPTTARAFKSSSADCSRRAAIGEEVIVEGVVTDRSDSTVTIVVCVDLPPTRLVGSYHGELTFPSTDATVARVSKPPGGIRVENIHVRGRVNFAGALSNGAGSGELLTVVLRTSVRGDGVPTRLRMLELNDAAGNSLLPVTRVDSVPPTSKAARNSAVDDTESEQDESEARGRQWAVQPESSAVALAAAEASLGSVYLLRRGPNVFTFTSMCLRKEP